MGLPGFSGFVAELQVIIGAWKAFPTFAVLTGLGILIGVAYTLRALVKAFFGEPPVQRDSQAEGEGNRPLEPITVPERIGAVLLIATTLVVGLYPQLLLNLVEPAVRTGLFEGLWKGTW
jgi:NADH-quinone oxidoreductase subunit M